MNIQDAIESMEIDLKELEEMSYRCNILRMEPRFEGGTKGLNDKIRALRLVLASAKLLHEDKPVFTDLDGITWANFEPQIAEDEFNEYGLDYSPKDIGARHI